MMTLLTQRLQGINVGSTQMLADVLHAFANSQIKPVISYVFDFEQATEALKHMGSGAHFGKIVVRVGQAYLGTGLLRRGTPRFRPVVEVFSVPDQLS